MRPSRDTKVPEGEGEGEKSSQAARGDQVVAARVTDIGQRIVLSVEVDQATSRATACLKGSLDPMSMTSDGEALSFKEITDRVMSLVLFEAEFRVAPDLRRDVSGGSPRFIRPAGEQWSRTYFVVDLPEILV